MTDGAAEFAPARVGPGLPRAVAVVPLLLIGLIALSVLGGRGSSAAEPATVAVVTPSALPNPAPNAVYIPRQAARRTWSVSNPNDIRSKGHRLMRLPRIVDVYER